MPTKLHFASILAGTTLAFAVPMLTPIQAEACGGSFCDTGPTSMPVDQTGENILFHIGENTVEAHIQIQIDPNTEAEKFAWVIPVEALPVFEVGSQILFDNMLAGSVPRYGANNTTDFCGDGGDEGGLSTGGDPSAGDGDGEGGATGDGDGDNGGPEVVFEGSVGAYEIAVLDGGTVEGVMTWLGDNGYQQDPNAEPILAQYLAEEYLFVALKLGVDQGVEDVHPIVIRYIGDRPCVPIRLTQIAASENMEIRAFFLDDARVVPTNYRHVLVNPLKIDWFNNAANYKEVITMAVDAQEANGNAFVTEYAGPSNVIGLGGVYDPSWDAAAYATLVDSPVGVYEILAAQNLMYCDIEWDQACTNYHPLLQSVLDQYIPVPDGVDPVAFYSSMADYADQIDLLVWDAAAFSAAVDERIVKPGIVASELVAANPYLTRMYTTISPNEMNADPMFRANPTLPEVQSQQISTQTLHCDGSTTVTIPDGREIFFAAGDPLTTWPEFQDEMPWDEDIDQEGMAAEAPLIKLVDNTEQIDTLLDEWNKSQGQDESGGTGDDLGSDEVNNGLGCGCTAGDTSPVGGTLLGLATLGLFGLIRRRRDD